MHRKCSNAVHSVSLHEPKKNKNWFLLVNVAVPRIEKHLISKALPFDARLIDWSWIKHYNVIRTCLWTPVAKTCLLLSGDNMTRAESCGRIWPECQVPLAEEARFFTGAELGWWGYSNEIKKLCRCMSVSLGYFMVGTCH